MAGNNPSSAIQNFLKPIRGVINCITTTPLHFQAPTELNKDFVLLLGEGDAVKLKTSSDADIGFILTMTCKLVEADGILGKWKIRTSSYNYQILENGEEVISYHWHPISTPHFWFPHLHVKGKTSKLHCPTGRVSIEEVARFLIRDFKVKAKPDSENILITAQKRFEEFRTWDNIPPSL